MATLATLRTALKTRLGLVSTTTTEDNRLDEALNGAVARTFSDGLPGLAESFVGQVRGDLSATITAHVAGTATVTLDDTTGVFPQDILVVGSTKFLIRAVSGSDLDIGIPHPDALSGSVTVTRRALELPHEGQVLAVRLVDGYELGALTTVDALAPFESGGDPVLFNQRWSADQDKSYVALYPAPATTARLVVLQERANAEDADIDLPYTALEPVLALALQLYLTWSGALDMAGLALRDRAETADLKHQATDGAVRGR